MDDNSLVEVIDINLADYDEKEHAFLTWVENGRSPKKTHEITGIPLSTVQDWVTRYGWRRRYGDIIGQVVADKVEEVRLSYVRGMHTALTRLLTDLGRDDLTPRDVREHVELLHKIGVGQTVSSKADGSPTFIDARQVHLGPHDDTVPDAKTLATKAIESNLKANEVRKQGRRGWQ